MGVLSPLVEAETWLVLPACVPYGEHAISLDPRSCLVCVTAYVDVQSCVEAVLMLHNTNIHTTAAEV